MNHHHNKLANSLYTCSVSQHGSHLWLCIYLDKIQAVWISFIASGIISSAEHQARLDSMIFVVYNQDLTHSHTEESIRQGNLQDLRTMPSPLSR